MFPTAPHWLPGRRRFDFAQAAFCSAAGRRADGDKIRPRAVQVADAGFTNENGEGSCRAVDPLVNIQTAT